MEKYIKFIVGKADKNISAAVRGELISKLENESNPLKMIYIVPDQFEYETEKAIYRILEDKGLLTRFYEINITTFTRLCREILEQCGVHRPFADDIVKNIIMHETVSENKSSLVALGRIAARPGFCGRMVKTVSALKTSGITARDLELSLAALTSIGKRSDKSESNGLTADSPVIKKLYETTTLYTNYEALMSEYVDKLDVTSLAADFIEKESCDTFKDACVFVDCFNDFTQSQLRFLESVTLRAGNITFGFTAQLNSDCDVFRTANAHIDRLMKFARDESIEIRNVTENIAERFAEDSQLVGISRHIFQNAKKRDALGDGFELVTARSVYSELDYVASKIKALTVNKILCKELRVKPRIDIRKKPNIKLRKKLRKLRYNEIAILCTDVGKYGKLVENTFEKYGIPYFLDTPEPILFQPLVNLVNSILNALDNFSVDTVLSCVKTRFFCKPKESKLKDKASNSSEDKSNIGEQLTLFDLPDANADKDDTLPEWDDDGEHITLSDKDVDEFESYIYEWDLKAKHLKQTFTFINKKEKVDYTHRTAERIRKLVAEPLWELHKSLKKEKRVNGAEITERLYDFLIKKVDIERAIKSRCIADHKDMVQEQVDHYQRLWDSLVDIFNKLHTELADTSLTLAEYGDLFREICAATKLSDPPQFIDCVLVGDIDRTRADNVKAAFIVGASYEAFPTPATEAGIFSQYEIERIYDKIVHIEGDTANADVLQYIEALTHIGDNNRREYCLKTVKEQYYLSLYRAYRAITLPTEYLCISCPKTDVSGEMLVCSDVFGEFKSTFRNVKEIAAESFGNKFYCRTPKATKLRYAMGLSGQSAENLTLREVLKKEGKEYGEFVSALDEIREIRRDKAIDDKSGNFSGKHSLTSQTARLLFPSSMGATAIEKLNACKFNYFCEYGLNIGERNQRSFTRNKRGDAMHHIFEKVLQEYRYDMNAFFALKRSELLSLTKKYLAEYLEDETNNDSSEDRRTEYLFNNIANSAADVLITMQTELFARRYRPKFFELKLKSNPENTTPEIINNEEAPSTAPPTAELFSGVETPNTPNASADSESGENAPYLITEPLEIELNDSSKITVQGIIDRVDMFTEGTDGGKTVAYIRVVDYKSSSHIFDLRNIQNGVNIQMLLYLFALQSANENNPTLELRPGGVSYIPSNNNGATDEELSAYRLLAMNYHESGLFIKDDVTEKDLENYLEFVKTKLESETPEKTDELEKIKGSFEPDEINEIDAKQFNELRNDVMQKIRDNLDALFSGTVNALPTLYSESVIQPDGSAKNKKHDPCEYCRFKEICQNAGKNVNRIEKPNLKSKVKRPDKNKVYWENKYCNKEAASAGEDDGE